MERPHLMDGEHGYYLPYHVHDVTTGYHVEVRLAFTRQGLEEEDIIDSKESAEERTPNLPYNDFTQDSILTGKMSKSDSESSVNGKQTLSNKLQLSRKGAKECIEDEKDYEIIEEDLNNVQVQYLEVWTRTKDYINNLDKQEVLEKFPEVLLLDGTYRVNCTKMPLFTLMVEDGYGCSIPVAHFFVSSECAESLDAEFAALKKLFVRARGDDAEWSLMKYKSCKQEDKHSCGVFVMMNAEAIAKGVPPRVMSQFHCSTYRRYVLGKLLHHGQTNEEIISFGCRSGYKGETADRILSFHKFPLKDPELMQRWLRRLQRKNFVPTENSRLCSLHFDDSSFVLQTTDKNKKRAGARDFSQLSKRINLSLMILRRLVINAVPSIFPNCPSYMKSEFTNECSASRGKSATTEGRQDRMNSQLQENIQNFWSEDSIKLIEDVYQKLEAQSGYIPIGFTWILQSEKLLILSVVWNDGVPPPQKFKHITSKEKLENFDTLRNLMAAVKNWIVISETDCSELLDKAKDSLEKYMDKCEGIEKQKQCGFLREQIGLLESSKKSRRYSPDCLISSYLLYAAYPNAYEEFRKQNLLCFPSSRTLRSLTSIIKANESKYLKSRFSNLNSYERHVILMIDEIYTASRVEYSSSEGKIIGLTTDNNVAGTILTFMISSIAGQYRDVVSFYPINGINAKKLHVSCLEVLKYLDEIGFNVTVLCVDNHPVNRAFLTNILCNGSLKSQIKNPVNDKPLFLLFDPVHNIKNVYNNFQGKRIFKLPSFHLDNLNFVTTAKFDDLCELHNLEATKPIKLGYKLTEKCLNPTSIEKSSVKLSMAVFNESTENALRFYSDHENKDWIGTATFISHFLKLWSIINVKNKSVGKFKRDPYREPITTVTDGRLTYLYDFANFLKRWQQNKNFCLTKETFTVMHHMCVTLPQIKSPITKEKNWIL
ncbi:THAP domain-containing protein 1 [Nymphon striatum]|nr:THAP domain-containing protein 1 [Nymphon striatum]